MDHLLERCINCGLTYGSHSAGDTVAGAGAGQCSNTENGGDWLPARGTRFKGSGDFSPVADGTPASTILRR